MSYFAHLARNSTIGTVALLYTALTFGALISHEAAFASDEPATTGEITIQADA